MNVNVVEAPSQISASAVDTETVGSGLTVMVTEPDWLCEQFVELASSTEIKLYVNVPSVVVGAVMVAVFPVEFTVWLAPPLMLYVKVYGAVPFAPVKVIVGSVSPIHTSAVPEILAVGNGFTVIVILPDCV